MLTLSLLLGEHSVSLFCALIVEGDPLAERSPAKAIYAFASKISNEANELTLKCYIAESEFTVKQFGKKDKNKLVK